MKGRIAVSALSLSAVGLLAIANFEGFSNQTYIPVPGDMPTVGFGHTDPRLKVGDMVTTQEALSLLRGDVREAEDAVRRCIRVPLTQGEFDAFVSLAYNIGGNAFCVSTLAKKANDGDYPGACKELTRWVYFKGKKLKGLENRRAEELRMCKGEE